MNKKQFSIFLLVLIALCLSVSARSVKPIAVTPTPQTGFTNNYVSARTTNTWTLTVTNTVYLTNLNHAVFTNGPYATNVVISNVAVPVYDYDEIDLVIRGALTVSNTPCTMTVRWGRTWDGTNGTSTPDIVQQATLAYTTPFLISTNIKVGGASGFWPASIEFTGTNVMTNFAIFANGVKLGELR